MARQASKQSADRATVRWAEHLPGSFLACRDMGHSWKPYTAAWEAEARQYRRELRCTRCRAGRVQRLSSQGFIESSHYVYPEDYLLPPGSGHYDTAARAAVHLASVSQLVAQTEAKAS